MVCAEWHPSRPPSAPKLYQVTRDFNAQEVSLKRRDGCFFSLQGTLVSLHTVSAAGDISMTHESTCEAKEGATEFLGSVSCWHQGLHCNFQARKPAEVIWREKKCDIKVWSADTLQRALGQAIFAWLWRETDAQSRGVQGPRKPTPSPSHSPGDLRASLPLRGLRAASVFPPAFFKQCSCWFQQT